MEAGTFIGIYSGELITEAIGESRMYMFLGASPDIVLTALRLYNEYGRTYLFDLRGNNYVVDAFHIGNVMYFGPTSRYITDGTISSSPGSWFVPLPPQMLLSYTDTCAEPQLRTELLDEERRYQ